MKIINNTWNSHTDRTRLAFLWTYILKGPFWAIFGIAPFVMYRDLHATQWQITCLIALKPIVSLFSFFWSALIHKRPDRLRSNVIWASVIAYLPFLFFPWINNPWYFVAAFAIYMLMARGVVPAWMEIMKQNFPDTFHRRIFANGYAFYYLGSSLFSVIFGWLLDSHFQAWRWIFPMTAILSFSAIFFQFLIPVRQDTMKSEFLNYSLLQHMRRACQNAWQLLQVRSDFFSFQIGFMLGGCGLMVMQPALPGFFIETLDLSYKELTMAFTVCKGLAFALSSSSWVRLISRIDIFRISGLVTLLAALFPLGLMAAQFHVAWVYFAYLGYGVMQAGSELSWHLSGPIFAKEEDSSLYSGINVLTVGLRGCIAPFLGAFLVHFGTASSVLSLGFFLCCAATVHLFSCSRKFSQQAMAEKILSD